MPSRKQRRRREKNFRHEYETVLLDADGTEHAIDEDELRSEREERAKAKQSAKTQPAKNAGSRGGRSIREVPPPSWRRAVRRGALMGGIILVFVVFVLAKKSPIGVRLAIGLAYAVVFIPLTYWVDRVSYRSYQRRLARQQASAKK
ncbi:MAG TPA: hypothetical protein VF094_08045 [Gaiellaceae bacterium]